MSSICKIQWAVIATLARRIISIYKTSYKKLYPTERMRITYLFDDV